MERQLSFSVGRFTIDLSGKSTVVLTADSNVQKRYFPICFSFNRKLDRWLDIVQNDAVVVVVLVIHHNSTIILIGRDDESILVFAEIV